MRPESRQAATAGDLRYKLEGTMIDHNLKLTVRCTPATIMCCLPTGVHSEKSIVRWFQCVTT